MLKTTIGRRGVNMGWGVDRGVDTNFLTNTSGIDEIARQRRVSIPPPIQPINILFLMITLITPKW